MNALRVLVTGASSGIGRACAMHLTARGHTVIGGVRREADGDALRRATSGRLTPLRLDVTDPSSLAAAVSALQDAPLDGLVNSAGIAVIGPLELVDLAAVRAEFEVNVLGTLSVIQAFLPRLRAAKGRIVTIGSIAGRSALPGSGAYDASKFAIEGLTDALRMELRPLGVGVSLIEPGAIATPMWDKSRADLAGLRARTPPELVAAYGPLLATIERESERSERSAIDPDAVVRVVEHALTARRPRSRYPVGRDAWFWLMLNLLPDRLRDGLILRA